MSSIVDAHILAVKNLMISRTAAGKAFFIQNNEPITFQDFCWLSKHNSGMLRP